MAVTQEYYLAYYGIYETASRNKRQNTDKFV